MIDRQRRAGERVLCFDARCRSPASRRFRARPAVVPPRWHSSMNFAASQLVSATSCASGWSGAIATKLAPKIVSGRVVQTSSSRRRSVSWKRNCRPRRLADPVLLHQLHLVRASARVYRSPSSSSCGEVGDLEEPLAELALLDQRARAPAVPVDHLLVGEHGLVDRVPVNRRFLAVDEPCFVEVEEQRLLVPVIFGIAGRELSGPVEREAQPLHLGLHVGDVLVGPRRRVDALFHRRVLGQHAERVPPHWVEDLVPGHAPEARAARRPSCNCGHGRYGCAPTDRGTSPAHSCAACRTYRSAADAFASSYTRCQRPSACERIEIAESVMDCPLKGFSRWRNGAGRVPW